MAGYSTTPLPKKLGIREGALVALFSAPPKFSKLLEPLPKDVRVFEGVPKKERFNVAIVFAPTLKDLTKGLFSATKCMMEDGRIWIAWPKKTSGMVTDVTEHLVREIGLGSALVDIKVCAIDDTWSGLCFVIRVGDRKASWVTTRHDLPKVVQGHPSPRTKSAKAK
jgi:hypothetical protein